MFRQLSFNSNMNKKKTQAMLNDNDDARVCHQCGKKVLHNKKASNKSKEWNVGNSFFLSNND